MAVKLSSQLSTTERQSVIGIGTSGTEFAQQVASGCLQLPVRTSDFNRERDKRVLEVAEYKYSPVVVDDIAVSGLTLWYARQRINPTPEVAAVGMLYKSKTTKERSGFTDIRAGLVYSRFGGGNPPINSIATLKTNSARLDDIALRYFSDSQIELKNVIREMK